ncbi:MAG: alpha/beta hydrolase [Acidobacteria bacterium]|nr:alpha/beta hydrolase [Acidobacteriota bacterium]
MRWSHAVEDGWFVRETRPEDPAATIFYIHGLGESGLSFEGLLAAPELRSYRQVAPDMPGYGRSAWPERAPSLDETVEQLADFWRRRGEAPAVVVGHSLGGVLGQLLAERHPGLVLALVDVDGNKAGADAVFSGRAAAEPLEEFVASGFDRLREAVYRAGGKERAQRGYYASLRLADPRVFHRHSLDLVALSHGEGLARRLAALPMPRYYVAGAPGGASARSLELLRESAVPTLAVAPAGHWPFLDQPALFAALLRDLVEQALRERSGE